MSGRQMKRHLSKSGLMPTDPQATSSSAMRKKRKVEVNSSEDDERSFWTPKHLGDLKAYNRSASEAPAELFRKDLISAMKLADSEPLTPDDYWGILDQWKQEWERGVQVPVNPDSLPEPSVIKHKEYPKRNSDFRSHSRLIRVTHNDFFNNEKHVLSNLPTKAEKMCRYDMDNLDTSWLKSYNGERARMGAEPVPDHIFELIVEHLEEMCWENIHSLLKAEEPLSIEFDEDVICDVCRSPDSEEGNEMVFCDTCNICVHQACYGITAIPSGSWLCRTCSLGIKPNCVLCPNKGGAMKSTKSGHKWAHVACALWIPEVSIGSVERMEPITKITNIPQSRWTLVCVLCRERWGACIQCSVKSCKTAYHVTCAFKHGLEMKAIIEDENADDVKLRSYCEKHSRNSKKECSDGDSDGAVNAIKKKKDVTSEQKNRAKAAKLRQIEAAFYKHVDALQTSTVLDIDFETTETIYYYWVLKRRSVFNKPLLTPRSQELELLADNKEHDIECMKMFVQLRQYLERVRNLCYMVSRREKLLRTFFKAREGTYKMQSTVLTVADYNLDEDEQEAIIQANHSPNIYDHIYSFPSAPTFNPKEFDQVIARIAGKVVELRPTPVTKEKSEKQLDINGVIKRRFSSHFANQPDNPYRKSYLNGAEQRKSRSRSASRYGSSETSSTEDSDSSLASTKWKPPQVGNRMSVFTSSDEDQLDAPIKGINNNAPAPHQFDFHPRKFKTTFDTSDEDRKKVLTPVTKARGRGTVKRGRGRPPLNRKVVKDTNSLLSSEDEKRPKSSDLKNFDALMKSTTRSFMDSSDAKIKPKYSCESSEDELPPKIFSPTRAAKNKVKKNFNAFTSSEDELPSKPTTRGRGRGRGRSRGNATRTSSNSAVYSWLTKGSDDDLAPATYKLTSDEEDDKSEASYKSPKHESEDSAKCGSDLDVQVKSKKVKAPTQSESDGDSSYLHLRTKGAVKEFTLKVDAEAVPVIKKRQVGRPPKKAKNSDKVKKVPADISKSRSPEADVPCDLNLFVPQRAAAKKASQLITSQNSNPPLVVNTPQLLEPDSTVIRKDSVSENESISSFNEDAKKSPQKLRKNRKDEKIKEDFPKKNIFEAPEILPYVPIREAARKAAENLKVGVKLNSLPGTAPEEPEVATTPLKSKKFQKVDRHAPPISSRTLRTKSPRSSSKGSTVSAASETEEEESYQQRIPLKEQEIPSKKSRSIFSESDEDTAVVKKPAQETVDAKKNLPNKNQLFRGDIYVFDHQSSSEDDDDQAPGSSGKTKESYRKVQSSPDQKKRNSFRNSRRYMSIFTDSLEDEHEAENKEPAAEAHRGAPDKKLKTSDGRPEHGFQSPVTKREEPRASVSSPSEDKLAGAPVTPVKQSESGLRKSGSQRGQRVPSGDVTKTNLRSNSDASPSPKRIRTRHQQHSREETPIPVTSPREAEKAVKISNKSRREISAEEPTKPSNSKPVPEKGFKSTFQCITIGKEEKAPLEGEKRNSAVFNFTENEVQVKRLDDIVEACDGESEPKRVKIADSDDESSLKAKVEQPKDSGYKSSITTPEPNESSAPGAAKVALSASGEIDSSVKKKTQTPQISPLEKSNSSKFLTSSKRKNLNDVIEERKKAAEMSECRNVHIDPNNSSLQRSSTESHYMESDNSETLHEGNQSATESSGRSPSTSNFVEEWRTQWVKSPQPPQSEHSEIRNQWQKSPPHPHQEQPPYKPLPHHHPMPMTDYPYLDLQQNITDNFMYLSHLQMMQYHHYLRQFSVSSNPPESQLDEATADLVRLSSHRDDRNAALPIHLNQSSKLSLVDDQLQRVKIPPQATRDLQMHQAEAECRRPPEIPPYSINTPSVAASSKAPHLPELPSSDSKVSSAHAAAHLAGGKTSEKPYLPKVSNTYKSLHQSSHVDSSGTTTTSHKNVIAKSQVVEGHGSSDTFEKYPLPSKVAAGFLPKAAPSEMQESQSPISSSATNRCSVSVASSVLPGITVGGQSVVSTSTVTTVHSVSTSVTSVSPSLPPNVSLTFAIESPPTSTHSKKDSPEIDVVSTNISGTTPNASTLDALSPKSSPPVCIATSPVTTVSKPDEGSKSNKSFDSPCQAPSTPASSEVSKRVPIYRQEPKASKSPDKYQSTRSNISTSPRWSKERKRSQKSSRGKKGRGRGRGLPKRGRPCRYNKVSVPKELVGTVYDFDQFDEFDDGPTSSTLGDLRMRRGKRQSVDSTPQHSFASPDAFELKASPPPKRTREKKSKSTRDKSAKEGAISPLKINLPLSDPLSLEDCKPGVGKSSYMQERRKSTPSSHNNKAFADASSSSGSTAIVSSFPSDGTNQLRLKIKGPYANACLNSSVPTSQPESSHSSASAATSSATSNLRRMRKKELIQQYCNQDMNVEQPDKSSQVSSNPPMQRAGISIPKAVASMPHIPTREDYKKYTQDDNSRMTATGRRKKPRELKQLDWSFKDECSSKRVASDGGGEVSRKRPRIAKENRSATAAEEKQPPKIVISLGKRSPEVISACVVEEKELGIRGKPPKKRLPDMMMKVKSDNLKFREEIMKSFDGSGAGYASDDDKRARRRRVCAASDEKKVDASEQNAEFDSQAVKVVTDEVSNKLVLKISKTVKEERGNSTPNAHCHPLKIKLNLSGIAKLEPPESHSPASNSSSLGGDNQPMKVKPLKIKRQAEGYVTSNCNVKKNTPLDHGPGPPQSQQPPRPCEPPDPYSRSAPDLPALSHCCGNLRIEHRDRESLTRDDDHDAAATLSDDMYQRLEAHLAATDGGVVDDRNSPSISQTPFSSLQPVPTIKDNPGCR